MVLLSGYPVFMAAIAVLTIGVINTGLTIKQYDVERAVFAMAFNTLGSILVLWALMQIIPPAFGIH